MNNRERALAILHYEQYDRMPAVHFGYWRETIEKWANEGRFHKELVNNVYDGSEAEKFISSILGFDFNWFNTFGGNSAIFPQFDKKVVRVNTDGSTLEQNGDGVIEYHTPGAGSIPSEVDHLLKDRASYEKHFKHRLQYTEDRIDFKKLEMLKDDSKRETPLGLHLGSLFGNVRNWLGVEGVSYLYADDEELYAEILNTTADLCYRLAERVLQTGVKFDFAHYWEDICFKNGPLVAPYVFDEFVGYNYKKINDLVKSYNIDIISLDCDGLIDHLIPVWFENGVNTMFPIEVGTWNASIAPWRKKYGKSLRGVGGMNKTVFAKDYKAVDEEIERLKPLIELGGYIPCPDHRIAPDAVWENVQYYCDRFKRVFSK